MKVSIEKKGPCRKIMTVELPSERVRAEYDRVLQKTLPMVRIPGFRKGRAPIALVENHYGRMICEDVKDLLVARTYEEALKKMEIDPVMILEVKSDLKKDQPLVYHMTVDVPPEFKLPRYKGLALKAAKIEVTDEMVEKQLQKLLTDYSSYEESDQPISEGDLVIVNFDATVDGRPMSAMGREVAGIDKGREHMLVVSPQAAFLPEFATELVGLKTGDEKDFDITFENQHAVRALRGKTANYHVCVNNTRKPKPAVLDAALFKRLEVADEAQLREKVRAQILESLQRNDQDRLKADIIKILIEKTSLDLPESVAQSETARVFNSMARQMLMRGVSIEQIKATRDELTEQAKATAAERVKISYILHRIAREEKIALEDAELEDTIKTLAQRHHVDVDTMRERLVKEDEIESIKYDLLVAKALEFVLANAKIGEEGLLSRLMGGGRKNADEAPPRPDAD